MAVTVIPDGGRQVHINGRHGKMIEAIAEHSKEWAEFEKGQIIFHFAGDAVRCEVVPTLTFNLPPARD